MAFRRDDWNDIIQQVNDAITNPPPDTDCEPQSPLNEVGPNHIWTKSDIQQVQDALAATCPSISFGPIPDLWQQSIIDEITDALGSAWCNCQPEEDDCKPADVAAENGLEFLLYDNGPPKIVSSCVGTENNPFPLSTLINGVQFGRDQVFGRIWRVFRRNHRNDGGTSQVQLAVGVMSCHGIVTYSGSATVDTAAGIGVNCFDCHDIACEAALADAAAHLGDPNIFYNTYVLVIDASGAACARPGDCP